MFMVLITPAIADHVRGYLSRFLTEPSPNVFVGNCSRTVADNLWARAVKACATGSLTMISSSAKIENEQGFDVRVHGSGAPIVYDLDGLKLLAREVTKDADL